MQRKTFGKNRQNGKWRSPQASISLACSRKMAKSGGLLVGSGVGGLLH